MTHFIEVIGPYDGVFVGPFDTAEQAESHKWALVQRHGNLVFDFYVMDKQDMDARIAEYGPIPVQAPETWEA